MTIHINDENFSQEVEQFSGVVLVDFFADWCGPCRMMAPVLDEVGGSFDGDAAVKVAKLNVDQSPDASSKYEIMSIPALILFKNGQKVDMKVGVQSKDTLIEWINANK